MANSRELLSNFDTKTAIVTGVDPEAVAEVIIETFGEQPDVYSVPGNDPISPKIERFVDQREPINTPNQIPTMRQEVPIIDNSLRRTIEMMG